MASKEREKSRDELDMKTLRELASLSCNKSCFDCGLRGPTYVNVTIGSFVCSSCGGILRGLNPPHRVKSLTMCSFTEVEMDRLKSRGNEYCTHIWLGKYDSKTGEPDLSGLDRRKEFMIQKYEEKKYYVDPSEAIKKMKPRAPPAPVNAPNSVSQSRSHTAIQRQHPPPQKPGVLSQTCSLGQIPSKSFAPDLSQSVEKDPFTQKEVNSGDSKDNVASFADFSSAFGVGGSDACSANSNLATHKKAPAPPPPDRYAALADLDNLHHQQSEISIAPATAAPLYWATGPSAAVYALTQNPFGAVAPSWSQHAGCQINPFQVTPQPMAGGSCIAGQPQQPSDGISKQHNLVNGGVPSTYWNPAWSNQSDPFATKTTMVPGNHNPWAQSYGAGAPNPFSNGSFGQPEPSSAANPNAKKNPFL